MPLKTAPSQLKAVHAYYRRNATSIKAKNTAYYLKNAEEIKRKQKVYYNKKKTVLQVPIIA
jgi:hypothetical protein